MSMARGPRCPTRPPGEPCTDLPMFQRSLSVWTVWLSLSSGGQHRGKEAAPGTLGTLPTGVVGGTYTETPHLVPLGPRMFKWGHGPSRTWAAQRPRVFHRIPHVPGRVKCTVAQTLCRPLLVQGVGTTGGGGVRRETSHTRWEAESERHVPATWCPPRPAGQAAHHALPPVREGDGTGLILDRPTAPPPTHAQPSTVCPLACHKMSNVSSCPLGRQGN